MFGRNKAAEPELVQPVDVETHAVSLGAKRVRELEAQLVATFEEWHAAQKASAEKQLHVEFAMTPWLSAAWSSWKADKYTGGEVTARIAESVMPPPASS